MSTQRPIATLGLLTIVVVGCVKVELGKQFDHQNRSSLQIGATTPAEAVLLLGEPTAREKSSDEDSNYEVIQHRYSHSEGSGGVVRLSMLEFRDGILNAKIYISSFEEDSTQFRFDERHGIEIDVSTEQDAIQLLGEPNGRAVCPSSLGDFKTSCEVEEARSVLLWIFVGVARGGFAAEAPVNTLALAVRSDGIVTAMNASSKSGK